MDSKKAKCTDFADMASEGQGQGQLLHHSEGQGQVGDCLHK